MMDKELIEMAKLADMRLKWGCIHRNLEKCPCHDTEQENCVGIEPVKVITSFESLKEFYRLATEKAVREALESVADKFDVLSAKHNDLIYAHNGGVAHQRIAGVYRDSAALVRAIIPAGGGKS